MPHDSIERWEWEGGAVTAEPDVSDAFAVEHDDLEPSPPSGHVREDDIAHPPAEQRRPERRHRGDVTGLGLAFARAEAAVPAL